MSTLVHENLSFFRLLAQTDRKQYKALIRSINSSQADAVREIAKNLDIIPIEQSCLTRAQCVLLRSLASRRISVKRISRLLERNRIIFLEFLRSILEYLTALA